MPEQHLQEEDDIYFAAYTRSSITIKKSILTYWRHGTISERDTSTSRLVVSHRNLIEELLAASRGNLDHEFLHARQDHLHTELERINTLLKVGVQPALAKLISDRERFHDAERDSLPAAVSPDYEWGKRAVVVLRAVELLTENFDDLSDRLSFHIKLIDQLKELLPFARSSGNRPLRSAVLTLHDALYSVYSEDLTQEQLSLIREMVAALQDTDWDLDQVRRFDKKLRNQGFETVPSDKSLVVGRA
jgi:hypothetical protein